MAFDEVSRLSLPQGEQDHRKGVRAVGVLRDFEQEPAVLCPPLVTLKILVTHLGPRQVLFPVDRFARLVHKLAHEHLQLQYRPLHLAVDALSV